MTTKYSMGQEVQLERGGVGIVDGIVLAGSEYFALENHPRGYGLVERLRVAEENRYHICIPFIGYTVTSGNWYGEARLDSLQS